MTTNCNLVFLIQACYWCTQTNSCQIIPCSRSSPTEVYILGCNNMATIPGNLPSELLALRRSTCRGQNATDGILRSNCIGQNYLDTVFCQRCGSSKYDKKYCRGCRLMSPLEKYSVPENIRTLFRWYKYNEYF